MNQPELPLNHPRISRVCMARLHNLGNYEHLRLEVTVELAPSTSPSIVIGELQDLLEALDPTPPVSDFALLRAMERIKRPREPENLDDPMERDQATSLIRKYEAWSKGRTQALQRFDALHGVSERTTHYPPLDDDGEAP